MNRKKFEKAIAIIILMVISAAVGFISVKIGLDTAKTASASQVIAFIIFFLPAFFLVIGIHEAGHAVAGTLVNFDFRMYVVGPFMWDREESGWKFKWNKNVNLSGGLVICLPNSSENMAKRFSMYALGGPAASLVFAGLAYGITLWLSMVNSNDNLGLNLIGSLFGLMSFLSLVVFVMTMIPLHSGGFYTDGARALRFLRGGDTSRFEVLMMKIISSSSGGIRPRLLNREEINEAMTLAIKSDAPMKVYLLYYLHQSAFDEDNLNDAEKYLEEYLAGIESIPKGIRGSVFLDAVFFYAYARNNLVQAEWYWKQYEPSAIIPRMQVLAAEAALHHLKKDYPAMLDKIDKALRESRNMVDRGVGIALREKLIQMKSHVDPKLSNPFLPLNSESKNS
jgi:hypothetical protein